MTAAGRNLARSGPNRREYQRAHYLAARLTAATVRHDTIAAPIIDGPANNDDLVAAAAAFADLYARQPTDRSGHQLFAAILTVGHRLAAVADRMADGAITIADCARPAVPAAAVTAARAKANEHRAQWARIRTRAALTDDDLAADPALGVTERRWRRNLLSDYRDSVATFLSTHEQAYGRDTNWAQRAAIRSHSYATVLRTEPGTHCLASRARTELDDLYRAHRPSLPGPAVCASVDQAPLTAGENALLTGDLGGLVGDGWRTADPHHRAFILGVWRVP